MKTESFESGGEQTVVTTTQSDTIQKDPQAVDTMPVKNSSSEHLVPKASKGDSSVIQNESMPDVIQDFNSVSPSESSFDASSKNYLTDLCDEAYVHPEEENTNSNVSVLGRRKPP